MPNCKYCNENLHSMIGDNVFEVEKCFKRIISFHKMQISKYSQFKDCNLRNGFVRTGKETMIIAKNGGFLDGQTDKHVVINRQQNKYRYGCMEIILLAVE